MVAEMIFVFWVQSVAYRFIFYCLFFNAKLPILGHNLMCSNKKKITTEVCMEFLIRIRHNAAPFGTVRCAMKNGVTRHTVGVN